jgi:signal peptidase I
MLPFQISKIKRSFEMQESIKKEVFSWIRTISFALIIAFLFRHFFFTPSIVHGESMSPTFHEDDKLIISKISKIHRFDTIVFNAPDANEHYVKRVIGLPGDNVEMKDDVLYINGEPMKEPYLEVEGVGIPFEKMTGDFTLEELTGVPRVPKGTLFVLGDNRLNSKDSRYFGFITEESVLGEVKFRIYPFQSIGLP